MKDNYDRLRKSEGARNSRDVSKSVSERSLVGCKKGVSENEN